MSRTTVGVLFVCMGNICRSPTAEGVFRRLLDDAGLTGRFLVDSAGTGDWHVGRPPDERSQAAALRRGIDISAQRARLLRANDLETFDFVVAMDRRNLAHVERLRDRLPPDQRRADVSLLLSHAPHLRVHEVPDPYQGGAEGFEQVLDLVEAGCAGLLRAASARLLGPA